MLREKKKHLYNFQKLPKDIIVDYFRNDKKNNCDVLNISQKLQENMSNDCRSDRMLVNK